MKAGQLFPSHVVPSLQFPRGFKAIKPYLRRTPQPNRH